MVNDMAKVFLDAGHGGHDSGAVGIGGRLEKTDNLRMVLKVGEYLTWAGITCMYSRTTDVYVGINERANMANSLGADIFAAFHRDSWTPTSNGAQTIVKINSGQAKTIADRANQRMLEIGFRNKGTVVRNDLGVLNVAKMPRVFFECGFVSNQGDNDLFEKHFDRICKAYAESIALALGISLPNSASAPQPSAPKYPIAYNAHLVGMGWLDAKKDGEFIGDKSGKVAIDGMHIDTRTLPQGMKIKACVVESGKTKDYGVIDNNTLIGTSTTTGKIETLEFTSVNPPAGYDFWYRPYFNGVAMQWTNRKIGTINTNLNLTGIQFRVCKISELVN